MWLIMLRNQSRAYWLNSPTIMLLADEAKTNELYQKMGWAVGQMRRKFWVPYRHFQNSI